MPRDLLGALAERDRPLLGHLGVDHAPAERGRVQRLVVARVGALGLEQHPRRAAHRLDAADEHQRRVAGLDRAAGLHRGVEARAAEAVDGRGGHARRQPGQQHRHAPDVAVVLARAVGVAEHDVVDARGVEVGRALEQRAHGVGGEVVGPHAGQRAARAPERRAHRVEDEGLAAHAGATDASSSRSAASSSSVGSAEVSQVVRHRAAPSRSPRAPARRRRRGGPRSASARRSRGRARARRGR